MVGPDVAGLTRRSRTLVPGPGGAGFARLVAMMTEVSTYRIGRQRIVQTDKHDHAAQQPRVLDA